MKLSCVIPSYKDPYLNSTINSMLENSTLGDDLEVIAVLDGYWQNVVNDPRVRVVHLGKNRGMRGAINAGVSVARGKYILRSDEHCMFAPGFDKELTDSCRDGWIMVPRRYFLDPVNWKVMDIPYVDYEKLVIQDVGNGVRKFAGRPWETRRKENAHKQIDQTMAMQGSCWIMRKSWWDNVIGELNSERYQPLYQDSHEMVFKTWKAGGKLVLNKNTWYAHKHRSFSRTHNNGTKENPSNNELCWANMIEDWEDYYNNTIRKIWKI